MAAVKEADTGGGRRSSVGSTSGQPSSSSSDSNIGAIASSKSRHPPSSSSNGSSSNPPPAHLASSPSRRGVLQLATAGGLYAWAARAADAADARAADLAADLATAGGGGDGAAADLLERQLAQRLTEFTLPNGLRFLVFERHGAPIASFHVYADVGAFDEVDGQTGLAHLLEHMAFKGTPHIGTLDYRWVGWWVGGW